MQATSLAVLFEFKTDIETAVRAALVALSPGNVLVLTSFSATARTSPIIAIEYNHGKALSIEAKTSLGASVALPSMFEGSLTIDVISNRADTIQSSLCSYVRLVLYDFSRKITPSYYALDNVSITGESNRIDQENKLDITTVSSQIVYSIKSDSWPSTI